MKVKQIVNDVPEDILIKNKQWTIDGKELSNQSTDEGNFKLATLQPDNGTYTAPAKVPSHNPVVITLSFQPEGGKTKIILYCALPLVLSEFLLPSSGIIILSHIHHPCPAWRQGLEERYGL